MDIHRTAITEEVPINDLKIPIDGHPLWECAKIRDIPDIQDIAEMVHIVVDHREDMEVDEEEEEGVTHRRTEEDHHRILRVVVEEEEDQEDRVGIHEMERLWGHHHHTITTMEEMDQTELEEEE